MRMNSLTIAAIASFGTLMLSVAATPAQSAPLGTAATGGLAVSGTSALEHVHRRCWRHRGHWHCRRHVRRWRPDYYHGGYYPRRHYTYRHRPGFAIYGPGFGLYIAPRYKRRYWY
jgi:hypothetical protein